MFKKYLIFLISALLFYSCAFMIPVKDKSKKKEVVQELSDEEKAVAIYSEAFEALKINYIKINIFPDGGISRFRIFGKKI